MKLSEAIRVGSKLRPASERGWVDYGPHMELRSCAMMAAAEAAGLFVCEGNRFVPGPDAALTPDLVDQRTGEPFFGDSVAVPEDWQRVTRSTRIPPCACGTRGVRGGVMELIWHLHDVHRWSREAVAEWIETVEKDIERFERAMREQEKEPRKERSIRDLPAGEPVSSRK